MAAASNYLEKKVLDHVLTASAYTQPGSRYLALFTNPSSDTATKLESGNITTEVTGGSYARTLVTFAAAVDGATGGESKNNTTVTFPTATAAWGTITHVAVMDAPSGGNVLFWGPTVVSKAIDAGDTFLVLPNNLIVTLN